MQAFTQVYLRGVSLPGRCPMEFSIFHKAEYVGVEERGKDCF